MDEFYAVILKGMGGGSHKLEGRIVKMIGRDSEQLMGRNGGPDFNTAWAWAGGEGRNWFRIQCTEEQYLAHWGINPESAIPASIAKVIEAGDFGCRKESVRALVAAILDHKKEA